MSRVPDAVVERVHLGEATSAQRARVLADSEARTRLTALIEADAAFLRDHPPDDRVPEIERRVHLARVRDGIGRRQRTLGLVGAGLVPLAAVALAFVTLIPEGSPTMIDGIHDPVDGLVQAKGLETRLHVFRLERGGPRSINQGAVMRQGDQLQLGYTRGDTLHGVMFSIDGRGAVTRHAPDDYDTSLLPGRHVMPFSYKLDDAPEFERFFLVTAVDPIDIDEVIAAAETLVDPRRDDLDLPDDLIQIDFLIRKELR